MYFLAPIPGRAPQPLIELPLLRQAIPPLTQFRFRESLHVLQAKPAPRARQQSLLSQSASPRCTHNRGNQKPALQHPFAAAAPASQPDGSSFRHSHERTTPPPAAFRTAHTSHANAFHPLRRTTHLQTPAPPDANLRPGTLPENIKTILHE